MNDHFEVCAQLIECVWRLGERLFVHGDLNPDNVQIDIESWEPSTFSSPIRPRRSVTNTKLRRRQRHRRRRRTLSVSLNNTRFLKLLAADGDGNKMIPQVVIKQPYYLQRYRPIELFLGSRILTQGSDLWALGCIIAQTLMGRSIFHKMDAGNRDAQCETDPYALDCIMMVLGRPPQELLEKWQSDSPQSMYRTLAHTATTQSTLSRNDSKDTPQHQELVNNYKELTRSQRHVNIKKRIYELVSECSDSCVLPQGFDDFLLDMLEFDTRKRINSWKSIYKSRFFRALRSPSNPNDGCCAIL